LLGHTGQSMPRPPPPPPPPPPQQMCVRPFPMQSMLGQPPFLCQPLISLGKCIVTCCKRGNHI
jgi:hypothetical protein